MYASSSFCKSQWYLIVANGLQFSMNDLHGILTQGDLRSSHTIRSVQNIYHILKSHHNQHRFKLWKFDDTLSFCAKKDTYQKSSKHRENCGRLSVIRSPVKHQPFLQSPWVNSGSTFSASSFSKVKLSEKNGMGKR